MPPNLWPSSEQNTRVHMISGSKKRNYVVAAVHELLATGFNAILAAPFYVSEASLY